LGVCFWPLCLSCSCIHQKHPRPHDQINMCIPLHVNIFHESILLILQYKYLKSSSEDFILKNLTKISFFALQNLQVIESTKKNYCIDDNDYLGDFNRG